MQTNKKLRILHVTQAFGGIQTFIDGILRNLDTENFELAVACQSSDFSRQLEERGIKYFTVSFVREPNLIRDTIALFQFVRVIKQYQPDIIHSHSAKAGFIGRLAALITRTKVIYTPNAFSFLGFNGYKRFIFIFLERCAKHFTTVLHTVSSSETTLAVSMLGYKSHEIICIPNSIQLPLESRQGIDYKNKTYRVGMIGRLIYQKNPEMFIDVACEVHRYMPEVKFALLGEGYLDFLKEKVFQLIENKNVSRYVEIFKWGAGVNSEEFFKKIDIFLLTSRFEGLPFALLEAMSKGIPSIATNVDGNRDVITHGQDGYLVDTGDSQTMAKYVVQLMNDDDLRREIGLSGREKVEEHFNLNINIEDYKAMYRNL